MTQETKQYVALTADEGKYITQANLEEGDERIFASRICTTDASAWTEWTQEQRDEWDMEHPVEDIE